MKRLLFFFPLILFMLFAIVFYIQLDKNAAGDSPTKLESVLVGNQVPSFRLEDLNQAGLLYSQDIFKKQPVLLNVWATWCPTCYAEHSYLNTLAQKGINIIGLNYKDDRKKAVNWLKQLGDPYLISLFDGDGMLGLDLGVYGAPETFLIDGNGIIRYRHVGDVNEQNWQETLEPLYKQMQAEVVQK